MNYNFICFDTEDNSKELMQAGKSGFDKRITQIATITAEGKRYYNKGNIDDFIRWLLQQPERFIYSLNIAYDTGALFSKKLDELDTTLVAGRTIKSIWGKKVYVDVFNLWPMSVKKLGKAFGLEKIETDDMAGNKEYVFRDVEIIRLAMLHAWQFCERMGLEYCPTTLGGLCVKVWKANGGVNSHDTSKLSKAAYYGGRVELFKVQNEQARVPYTDINSLYPAMMLTKFPATLEEWKSNDFPDYGVADVEIIVPECHFAPLPYRREDGAIVYPFGTMRGSWTIHEINQAVLRGAKIIKVHQVLGTNDYEIPYSSFVNRMYKERLQSTSEAEKLFFKLLMNNLYGRLGTSGVISRTVWQTAENKHKGPSFGKKVLVDYAMPLSDETNWSHAAYTTSYGRIKLLEYMEKIGEKRMIYCDTDSTIFDLADNEELPFETSSKLGEMKLESIESIAVTYAPKMYQYGDHYKAKGVPVRLAKQFIETGKAEFDLPYKTREAIRFYDKGNTKELAVWHRVQKHNRQKYDKKRLSKNKYFPCNVSKF